VVFPGFGKVINSIRVCLQAFTVDLEFSTGAVSNYEPLNAKTNLITVPILVNGLNSAIHVKFHTCKHCYIQKWGKFDTFCFDKGFGLQQALKIRVAGPIGGNLKNLKTAPARIVRTNFEFGI
jgi:hypothetical protein